MLRRHQLWGFNLIQRCNQQLQRLYNSMNVLGPRAVSVEELQTSTEDTFVSSCILFDINIILLLDYLVIQLLSIHNHTLIYWHYYYVNIIIIYSFNVY